MNTGTVQDVAISFGCDRARGSTFLLSFCFVVWLCCVSRVCQTKKRVPFSSSPMRKCSSLFLCLSLVECLERERDLETENKEKRLGEKRGTAFSRRVDRTIFFDGHVSAISFLIIKIPTFTN